MANQGFSFTQFHTPKLTRSAREIERVSLIIGSTINTLLLFAVTMSILFVALQAVKTLYLTLASTVILFVLKEINKKSPQTSGNLTVIYLISISVYAMATGYGIYDVSHVLLSIALLIGSLTLSLRSYIIINILMVSSIVRIGIYQYQVALPTPVGFEPEYIDITLFAILIIATAVFTRLVASSILTSLRDVEQKEENFRVIFNATNDAIFLYDYHNHTFIDGNDALRSMYNLDDRALENISPVTLSTAQDSRSRRKLFRYLHRAVHQGVKTFEWQAKKYRGAPFWVEITLKHTIIQKSPCILGVIRDIDESKNIQEELRQSEKLTAIGQLAGGIAHDFNNQLTGIIGLAELLERRCVDDDTEMKLHAISNSARRAADLTGQLLSFARKGNRTFERVDVNVLIEETQQLLERSVDKQISIKSNLTSKLPAIFGDGTQLQNAFLNLGINARDAIHHGGTIRYKTSKVTLSHESASNLTLPTEAGTYVAIHVSDTGSGISTQIAQRIFDPFFTTKPSGEGTGMGLSVVYGTVQEHHGGLNLSTVLGQGTTITLYLPVADKENLQKKGTQTIKAVANPIKKGRILVVDDEPVLRLTIKLLLEHEGHTISTAESGVEALEHYKENYQDIDLILLDMIMPDMNGLETLKELQKVNPNTPVIIASGYSTGEDLEEAMRISMVKAYLAKPFKPDELPQTVAAILEAEQQM